MNEDNEKIEMKDIKLKVPVKVGEPLVVCGSTGMAILDEFHDGNPLEKLKVIVAAVESLSMLRDAMVKATISAMMDLKENEETNNNSESTVH